MNFAPNTTVILPLEDAYRRAPLLRRNVHSLLACANSQEGRFIPVACQLSSKAGDESELTGLLDAQQQRKPGALVVLPDAADAYLDVLLEEDFVPVANSYDGLMRCMAAFSLRNDVSGIVFEMDAFRDLGRDDFFLAIVCNDKLRVRCITNQTHLDDEDDSQGLHFSVANYRPYQIYSQEELDDAARMERESVDEPYWLVRTVVRLGR